MVSAEVALAITRCIEAIAVADAFEAQYLKRCRDGAPAVAVREADRQLARANEIVMQCRDALAELQAGA